MTNIIVTRYPTGKVETMKVWYDDSLEDIGVLPLRTLRNLAEEINDEIEYRKKEELNKLKKDAEEALKSFLDAGGYVISGGVTYSSIGEDFDLKEPIIFLS